jgi:hypothetical protein
MILGNSSPGDYRLFAVLSTRLGDHKVQYIGEVEMLLHEVW